MGSARTAVVLTGLLLVFPGAALAQSSPSQGAQAPDTGQNAPPLSSSSPSSPSPSSSPAPKPAPPAATAASARRLPSTGADAGMLALTGAGLLLTGAGLRLRLREPSALTG